MNRSTPRHAVEALLEARGRRDVAAAVACYEPHATVVLEPGKTASGVGAIRAFTEATTDLAIAFGAHEIVESGNTALHLARWTLRPAGGSEISGCTTDVLRRQPDGDWLFAIDNAWGVSLLDKAEAI